MIPAHFICWNHFYSFLSVQTRVQEIRRSGPPETRRTLSRRNHFSSFPARPAPREPGDQARRDAPHFFSREPVFLIPSRSDRSPGSQEIGLAGMHRTFLQGNHFPSFLPARTAAMEARRSGSPGCTALFFKGTTFPHSLCFADAVGRTRLSPAVLPLSSSPQRDSGILAVRKKGASVFPLLPPTS
jgi:hypothetical protein